MRLNETTLETERLILRPLTTDDFKAAHSWGSNPENTRYMAWGPNSEEQTKEFLAQAKQGCDFAVVLKGSNAVIGSCGIYPAEVGYMGDVGWILHKDYWKHGYGTELGRELIRYGFEDLKLGRIQAPCAAVNYGSYRVMERIGMRREALHRKAFWERVDKEWIDEVWYAILAEDYFQKTVGEAAIRYVTESDKVFWFTLDNHFSESEFELKVRDKCGYIISDGDKPIGVMRYNIFWDNTPFLTLIILNDSKRGKGYGRQAMLLWENEMRELGYKMVMISTQADEQAQHFYRKLGYLDRGALFLDGTPLPQPTEIFMVKVL
ncbi:MAG: GNAT family N-acetyltransferase [Lachnospiraceae bacterium]|nr:GNAT family N-acetyltransferase [Lachnospiraceae bacterium]